MMIPAALMWTKVVAPAFSADASSLAVPSTLVLKNGSRGPENRNSAAAVHDGVPPKATAAASLAQSPSTSCPQFARSFAWEDAERPRANT